jgi:dimethylamine monooxygenase subunit A
MEKLAKTALYFPLESGRYEVKPGMVRLGSCFGNGVADGMVFQIDENFSMYRQSKVLARGERLEKYYQIQNYSDVLATAVGRLIITRLVCEHPQCFQLEYRDGFLVLHCQLTQEMLLFDGDYRLQDNSYYVSTLDALASQVQEDITVICRDGSNNWVSAIHLCFPNHWSAEDKIGRDFATVHTPVAGMEKINRCANAIVNTMIVREPMVRFAWGLCTDTCLNHHPGNIGVGRSFDINNPRLYLRIERQVIWGLPECDAAMFTIRTYFRDVHEIRGDEVMLELLLSAIRSMGNESLLYKGLVDCRDAILDWLNV